MAATDPGPMERAGDPSRTPARDQSNGGDGLDYDALRARGIELVQALSSEHWTDYNVHDPGVTILEQCCYALTDLAYRAELDVADLLTGDDGRIHLDALALHPPEEALPSRPTTVQDYRRALLDAVADIENLWLDGAVAGSARTAIEGLYRIEVRPRSFLSGEARDAACVAVRDAYRGMRNLCEDVESVVLAPEDERVLVGRVEVERWRDPAELLAEIYARAAAYLAGEVTLRPFEDARRDGRPLDEILDGPLGRHGFFHVGPPGRTGSAPVDAALVDLLGGIEGVDYVHEVRLADDGQPGIDDGRPAPGIRLRVPRRASEIRVELRTGERVVPVSFAAFTARFERWTYRGSTAARTVQDVSKLRDLPAGTRRDVARYASIQNQLPATYGISDRGMPRSASAAEQGRALQLRGYLLLFDQIMANFNANVAALPSLFAGTINDRRTYASQPVRPDRTPDVEKLYDGDPRSMLAAALADLDDFDDRKGRLLDHLLALHGEEFTQRSLRGFDLYSSPGEREHTVLENKAAFLDAVVELGRDRGAGMCPARRDGTAASGLARRVGVLLGFGDGGRPTLTGALVDEPAHGGLADVPGDRYAALDALRVVAREEICAPSRPGAETIVSRPTDRGPPGVEREDDDLSARLGDLLAMPEHPLGARLFAGGVAIERYRLGHLGASDEWHLFFDLEERDRWCALGAFGDPGEATRAANDLRRRLVELNRACEGLHVVEHVLLRPRSREPVVEALPGSFYSFRLSAVFPDWTARCALAGFRNLARETVVASCPAHVAPTLLWLSPLHMREFERLHAPWLELWADGDPDTSQLDRAARALADFLVERERESREEC